VIGGQLQSTTAIATLKFDPYPPIELLPNSRSKQQFSGDGGAARESRSRQATRLDVFPIAVHRRQPTLQRHFGEPGPRSRIHVPSRSRGGRSRIHRGQSAGHLYRRLCPLLPRTRSQPRAVAADPRFSGSAELPLAASRAKCAIRPPTTHSAHFLPPYSADDGLELQVFRIDKGCCLPTGSAPRLARKRPRPPCGSPPSSESAWAMRVRISPPLSPTASRDLKHPKEQASDPY